MSFHETTETTRPDQGRTDTLSGPGKSLGTGMETFPVAAHSVPRANVVWKPTHFLAAAVFGLVGERGRQDGQVLGRPAEPVVQFVGRVHPRLRQPGRDRVVLV